MDFLLVLLMLLNLENLTAFNGSMYVRFFCIKPNLNFGRQVFGLDGEKFQAIVIVFFIVIGHPCV